MPSESFSRPVPRGSGSEDERIDSPRRRFREGWERRGRSTSRSRSPGRREVGYKGRSPSPGYGRSPGRPTEFRERMVRRRSPSPYDDGYKAKYVKDGYRSLSRYGEEPVMDPRAPRYRDESPDRRRYRDDPPERYSRTSNEVDAFGRYRRLQPENVVSNYDFDHPGNSRLNDPIAHPELAPKRPELVDPLKIPDLVSIDYYADFLRFNEPNDRHSDNSIQKRYKVYQDMFYARQVSNFFVDHKAEPWFSEKYEPKNVEERINRLKPERLEELKKFIVKLEDGLYDNICYDTPAPNVVAKVEVKKEKSPESDNHKSDGEVVDEVKAKVEEGESGEVKEEEEEDTQVKPEDKAAVTFKPNKEERKSDNFQALFIKSIPPTISRQQLIEVCQKVEGFHQLILGEPNPTKRFHRLAWVLFDPEADLEKALIVLDKSNVDEFQLYFAHHNQKTSPRLTHEIACTGRRLNIDMHQAQKVAKSFEAQYGEEFKGSQFIEERLAVVFRRHRTDNQAGAPFDDVWETKKTLDFYICYMRKVFNFCYYCCAECDNNVEFQRKCIDDHLRTTPRANQNRSGDLWAENLDTKIDRKLISEDDPDLDGMGGKNTKKVIEATVSKAVEEVSESKYRCTICQKLFKGEEYVRKHVASKHPESYADAVYEAKFLNNYVRDPNRTMPSAPAQTLNINTPFIPQVGIYPMINPMFPGIYPMNPMAMATQPIRMGFMDPMMQHQQIPAYAQSGLRYKQPSMIPAPAPPASHTSMDPRQLKSYVDLDAPDGDLGF